MGQQERHEENRRANKRERAKESRGRRSALAGQVDVATLDWGSVIALFEVLAEAGGAVRVGKTRDGGAWALGIYLGDDYATEYIRPAENFQDACGEIVEAWLDAESSARWLDRVIELRAGASR